MTVLGDYLRSKVGIPGARRQSAPRIDGNLPLNIKIGTIVGFDPAPIVMAQAAGLLIKEPERQTVRAYGKIRYQGFTIYRFYLEDGEHMLQVALDGSGKIDGDPFLYRLTEEIRPATPDEWTVWVEGSTDLERGRAFEAARARGLSEQSAWAEAMRLFPDSAREQERYLIGFKTFDLKDLATGAMLASYARMWPNSEDNREQVKPEMFTEFLFTDPFEGGSIRVRQDVMLYGRVPPKPEKYPAGMEVPSEYIFLSKAEYPSDAVVQVHLGTPYPAAGISVVLS